VVSGALGLISILLANKGVLPAIIIIVIIFVFVIGGARYLGEMIGDKQQKTIEGAEEANPEKEKAPAYKARPNEKL